MNFVNAIWTPESSLIFENLPMLVIKCTLWLGAFLFLVKISGRASAAWRHYLLTLSVAGILVLPVFAVFLPAWPLTPRFLPEVHVAPSFHQSVETWFRGSLSGPAGGLSIPEKTGTGPTAPTITHPEHYPALGTISTLIWLAGALIVLARLGVGALRLRQCLRAAQPISCPEWKTLLGTLRSRIQVHAPVQLMVSDKVRTPMTCGWFRAVILLPVEKLGWEESWRRDVLAHELAHVKRRDCLTQALAQIACVFYWFHPLVWLAARGMRYERERACDDVALAMGAKPSSYAGRLLEAARAMSPISPTVGIGAAMMQPSQLGQRLEALLNPGQKRNGPVLWKVLAGAVLTLSLAMPLAALGLRSDSMGLEPFTTLNQTVKEIQSMTERFEQAFRRGDVRTMAEFYATEAIVMPPGAPSIRGRQAIEAHWQSTLDLGFEGLKLVSQEVRGAKEMVYETGVYRLSGPDGTLARGAYLTVWKREAGSWLIYREVGTLN